MKLIGRTKKTCRKITVKGTRCKLPPFEDGLCKLHAFLARSA